MKLSIQLLRFGIFCCLFVFSVSSNAQVTVKAEGRIDELMTTYMEINKSMAFVSGWRIQLMATTDRQRMESALQQFRALYPSIPIDWVHVSPYFKLRAGAYANKLEAMRILYILKKDYPSAYPAVDNQIRPAELLN
ncbi:MAG: SPOR domain-containing protein [Saprospiraceae bacterium]|nr:SPOR domain-containing protein [Saprospiraceae bacterium]